MFIVGLVGQIASGKSTVARMFRDCGAQVIDADLFAAEVLDLPDVQRAILDVFGPDVQTHSGICRQALAEAVFGSKNEHKENLDRLERIIHPQVRERIEAKIETLNREERTEGKQHIVILDIPLLIQAGWGSRCNMLIRIKCTDAIRSERLSSRNISLRQQEDRDAAWMRNYSEADVPSEKTITVDTSGSLAYTKSQIQRVWVEYLDRSNGT